MKYEDVKTPTQLLKYMDENIKYGFVDDDGQEHTPSNNNFQEECKKKWRLSSPERLIKVKYGHCWDQVELEREWFEDNGYIVHTFYIWFELPYNNSYSTHTYLIFEMDGKYHYFEHSDFSNKGIHTFLTLKDAINYQRQKHIEHNEKRNIINKEILDGLCVYEYEKPPFHCTMEGFIENILNNGKKQKRD